MANNDLAFRFTEENYSSKSEVMKALNTSLVDNIWANIISYRKQYNVNLGLHTFNGSEYVLCNCHFITSRNSNMEMKLLRLMRELSNLGSEDYNQLEYQCCLDLLKEVAIYNGVDSSDVRMRAIVRNEVKSLDNDNIILTRYLKAIKYLKRHYLDDITLDYIHTIHKFLIESDDMSYRKLNDNTLSNRVVIDRIYTSAPINLIEPLLSDLVRFIANSGTSAIIKSYIAYYYFKMIKPFAKYSDEIAILIAKAILAKESMGELAFIVPMERLLNENANEISKLFIEVQKNNDVTYFVRYGLDFNDKLNDDFINKIVNFKANFIKQEFYAEDNEVVVEEKKEERKEEVVNKPLEDIGQIAINFVPTGLDEKEAAKLEVHLLELDPSLKKKEARFYARHCTLGKNYTIQQFKKYNGVAYETARTSMDHLAELGYYRKEQVKNKFIYSPINRR